MTAGHPGRLGCDWSRKTEVRLDVQPSKVVVLELKMHTFFPPSPKG